MEEPTSIELVIPDLPELTHNTELRMPPNPENPVPFEASDSFPSRTTLDTSELPEPPECTVRAVAEAMEIAPRLSLVPKEQYASYGVRAYRSLRR